jgi:hypothetical protein
MPLPEYRYFWAGFCGHTAAGFGLLIIFQLPGIVDF